MLAIFTWWFYVLCTLAIAGVSIKALTIVAGLFFFTLWREFSRVQKFDRKLFLFFLCAGAAAGSFWAWGSMATREAPTQEQIERLSQKPPLEATIIRVSSKSLIAEIKNNTGYKPASEKALHGTPDQKATFRLRISFLPGKEKWRSHEKITFNCHSFAPYSGASFFEHLESLQAIAGRCRAGQGELISLKKPLFDRERNATYSLLERGLKSFHEKSFARGFLLADTSGIAPFELGLLRKMGVAHLFSASGLHLGILYGFCLYLFVSLGAALAGTLSLLKIKKVQTRKRQTKRLFHLAGTICGFILAAAYLVLLDFRLSLMRAFLFLLLYLLCRTLGRKTESIHLLFLTALIMEWLFPLSSFSPSFILSFGITWVILIAFKEFQKSLPVKNNYLKDHVALTLSAFSGSAVLSFVMFDYVHVMSFFYNLVLVPFSGVYLVCVMISLIFEPALFMVGLGDELFHTAAALHYRFWEMHWPAIYPPYVIFWLIVLMALFFLFLFKASKKHHLVIRKRIITACALLAALFFGNLLFTNYPEEMRRAFPYGIIEYKEKSLLIHGERAGFLSPQTRVLSRLPEVPIKEVQVPQLLRKEIYKTLPPYAKILKQPPSSKTSAKGMIVSGGDCHIFVSLIEPQKWKPGELKNCQSLYVVLSKKQKEGFVAVQWKSFFKLFGYRDKEIETLSYNHWYEKKDPNAPENP